MPTSKNRIDFTVGFKTDQSGLNELKKSLQDIQKKAAEAGKNNTLDTNLKNAATEAKKLEQILNSSWNSKLNQLDLSKLSQSINSSYGSVEKFRLAMKNSGAEGAAAYNKIASAVLNTNVQLRNSNQLLDKMAVTFANTIRYGISSSVFNRLTGSIQEAWNYTKNLDTSLNDIRIVTGDSADQMERFARQANEVAKTLGSNTLDYTKTALSFYQQGLDDEAVNQRTEATIKAANVTGARSQDVAEYLTAVWNGFKVEIGEETSYVDKLAAVADSSASNLAELATAMSKVASVANNMGVDINQLNAQISTIIATTRQAPETVGNALKTIYARINDIKTGSDEAEISLGNYSAKMASLGINVLDSNNNLRETGEVFEEIGAKWQGMSREQQVYLAQTMAGQRQMNNLIALFDNWTKYSDMLNVSLEAQGTLDQKNNIYLESTAAHLKELSTEAERTYDIMFDQDTVNGWTDAFSFVLKGFNDFIQGLGGGGKALLYFGSLAANVFNKQIASGVQNAVNNVKVLIANLQGINLKNQFAKENALQVNAMAGINVGDNALNQQIALAKDYLSVQQGLTVEQQRQYIEIQKQIGLEQQRLDDLNNYAQRAQAIFNEPYAEDKTVESLQAEAKASLELSEGFEKQRASLMQNNAIIKEGTFLQKTEKDVIKDQLNTITELNNQGSHQILTEEEKLVLQKAEEKLQGDVNAGKAEAALTETETLEIVKIIIRLRDEEKQRVAEINELIDDKKAKEAGEEGVIRRNLEAHKNQAKALAESGRAATNMQKSIRGITAAGMVLSGVIGTLPTLFDEAASGADKAQAMTSMISSAATGIGAAFGPVGMAIGGVVGAIAQAIGKTEAWQNAFKSTAEKIDEINQKVQKMGESATQFNQDSTSVKEFADEFEELSKKAGAYDKNIDNLTDSERKRYNELKNTLVGYNEEIVAGYTDQGEVILKNVDAIQAVIDKLEEQYEVERAAAYANFDKDVQTMDQPYEDAEKNLEKLQKIQSSGNFSSSESWYEQERARLQADFEGTKDLNEEIQKLQEYQNYSFEEILENKETFEALVQELENNGDLTQDEQYIFADAKNMLNAVNDYYNQIESLNADITAAEQTLERNKGFNISWLLGALKYAPDEAAEYEELQYLGVQNTDAYITEYLSGVQRGLTEGFENSEQAIETTREFEEKLVELFKASPSLEEKLQEAANNINPSDYESYNDYTSTVINTIKDLIASNPDLQTVGPEVQEAIFQAIFGFDFSNFDNLEDLSVVDERIDAIVEKLRESTGDAWGDKDLIGSILSSDDLDNFDVISSLIEKAAQETDSWGEILEYVKEELEEIAKVSVDLEQLNDVLETLNAGDDLDKDQLAFVESLKDAYKSLADAQLKGKHEYLNALRAIREQEEKNHVESLQNTKEELEAQVAELEQALSSDEKWTLEIDKTEAESQIQSLKEQIEATDFSIKVAVNADFDTDVENAFGLARELEEIGSYATETLRITFDEAQEIIAAGYGGMLIGAQETADNMIQIDRSQAQAFLSNRAEEVEANRLAKIDQLEHEKSFLQAQLEQLQARKGALETALSAETEDERKAALDKANSSYQAYLAQVENLQNYLNENNETSQAVAKDSTDAANAAIAGSNSVAEATSQAAGIADSSTARATQSMIQNAQAAWRAYTSAAQAFAGIGTGTTFPFESGSISTSGVGTSGISVTA